MKLVIFGKKFLLGLGDILWNILTLCLMKHHNRVILNPFISEETKIKRINKRSLILGYYATKSTENKPVFDDFNIIVMDSPFILWKNPQKAV